MDLIPDGHPIHTRVLSVILTQSDDGCVLAHGSLLDLRKRGFCPVGTELQGMGIIHQMEVDVLIAADRQTVLRLDAAQPTIAFELSPGTQGETCRDPIGRLAAVRDVALGDPFTNALRNAAGGPLGCSHVVTLAQLINATAISALQQETTVNGSAPRRRGERIFRRDLVFDGHQRSENSLGIALQLGDLHTNPTADTSLAPQQFGSHYELRLNIQLDGWPAVFAAITGAERRRQRSDFASAAWKDVAAIMTPLGGTSLEKGSGATIARALATMPPARDALLMLGPALIQCRASFPDKWLNRAIETPSHPGLIAMGDSCYMWRRGGALERTRLELQKEGSSGASAGPDIKG